MGTVSGSNSPELSQAQSSLVSFTLYWLKAEINPHYISWIVWFKSSETDTMETCVWWNLSANFQLIYTKFTKKKLLPVFLSISVNWRNEARRRDCVLLVRDIDFEIFLNTCSQIKRCNSCSPACFPSNKSERARTHTHTQKKETTMEEIHSTEVREQNLKMGGKKIQLSQHFPSHCCQFNMMQAVKKTKEKKQYCTGLMWVYGWAVIIINNNNKNQMVIP